MTNEITIPLSALALLDTDGFIRHFYMVMAREQCDQREAFALVNGEYESAFRRPKYASYASFEVVRCRWYARQEKPPTKKT